MNTFISNFIKEVLLSAHIKQNLEQERHTVMQSIHPPVAMCLGNFMSFSVSPIAKLCVLSVVLNSVQVSFVNYF